MLRFEAAVFGLTGDGHRALRASLPLADLPPSLDGFTDRPRGTNYVATWEPYFAAKAFGGWLAFTYTLPDPNQPRAGAVSTRVLLLERAKAAQLSDLRTVFASLAQQITFAGALEASLELGADGEPPPGHVLAGAIAHALRTGAPEPIVLALEDDAWAGLAAFWGQLWPSARGSFSFRTLFDPDDLESPPPSVVVTPRVQIPRWRTRHILPEPAPDAGPIERCFSGGSEPLARVLLNNLEGASLTAFRPLHALHHYIEEWRDHPTIRAANGILQTMEVLELSKTQREALDREVRPSLPGLIDAAGIDEVLFLAVTPLSELAAAARAWCTRLWRDCEVTEAAKLLRRTHQAQPWWRDAVLGGIADALSNADAAGAAKVWTLLSDEQVAVLVLPRLGPSWELALTEAMPAQFPASTVQHIAALAAARKWWRLYSAATILGETSPLGKLLDTLPDAECDVGLYVFKRARGSAALVEEVVRLGDARTFAIAADAIAEQPEILRSLSLDEPIWLELWMRVMPKLPTPWTGIQAPTSCWSALCDRLRGGARIPEGLFAQLARTPEGHFLDQPDRPQLWTHLPAADQTAVLTSTARAWLRSSSDPGPAEPPLLNAILQVCTSGEPWRDDIYRLIKHIGDRLPFPMIEEMAWLAAHGRLDPLDAAEVGKLVCRLRLSQLARRVTDHVLWHPSDPGLTFIGAILNILPAWTRARATIWHPHLGRLEEGLWWQALEELAMEKAPRGPREFWVQAGGREAELAHGHSPAEVWRLALESIRQGRGPSLKAFLEVMREEFPHDAGLSRFLDAMPHT